MAAIQPGMTAPDFALDDVFEKKREAVRFQRTKSPPVLASRGLDRGLHRSDALPGGQFREVQGAEHRTPRHEHRPESLQEGVGRRSGIQDVTLLCDFWPHGKVAQEYGIFIEEFGMSQRANIIGGEDGTVKWVKVYPISQLPDIQEVLQALSEI
jgi:peroxiredoxin